MANSCIPTITLTLSTIQSVIIIVSLPKSSLELIIIKPALVNELSLSQTIVRGIFLLNTNPEYHRVGAYRDD